MATVKALARRIVGLPAGDGGPYREPGRAPTEIPAGTLQALAEGGRFRDLDRREAYFRARQDDHKRYDWEGYFRGYGDDAAIKPGWYVPLGMRRPAARYDLAKVIVRRLTTLLFGSEHFPQIVAETDPDTEDFVRTLARESRLGQRMMEARELGGALGTACLSSGFVDGSPRLEVHNAKHCRVLRWRDRAEFKPSVVLKAYAFEKEVWDPLASKWKREDFFYARYWDEQQELVWEEIPADVAKEPDWQDRIPPSAVHIHGWGFCPFYWIQNRPATDEVDGESDYDGLHDIFDEINQLLSATGRGTKRNVDPTLVVHANADANRGAIKKGSDNAIFSPGGAKYLELSGESVRAARDLIEVLRGAALDAAGVVLADPEKLSGAAQSAAAMRIIYAPMLANADILREQYGEMGIRRILEDMLRMARVLMTRPAQRDPETGEMQKAAVVLPPRVLYTQGAGGELDRKSVDRKPGTATTVGLNWPAYFPATTADVKLSVESAQAANGGKQVISRRSSVLYIAQHFGVEDVDQELVEIEDEERETREAQEAMMAGSSPELTPMGSRASDIEDDEDLDGGEKARGGLRAGPGPMSSPKRKDESNPTRGEAE